MLATVARGIGCGLEVLRCALLIYEEEKSPALLQREDDFTRAALAPLGVDVSGAFFSGVHWFHGARTLDRDRYRRDGLLPLPAMLDSLWDSLFELVREDVTRHDWNCLRSTIEGGGGGTWAADYRCKVDRAVGQPGPFGELVRTVILDPKSAGSSTTSPLPSKWTTS